MDSLTVDRSCQIVQAELASLFGDSCRMDANDNVLLVIVFELNSAAAVSSERWEFVHDFIFVLRNKIVWNICFKWEMIAYRLSVHYSKLATPSLLASRISCQGKLL